MDLIESDVSVVDRDGKPVTGLVAADFVVTVDGTPRRVATLKPVTAGGPSATEFPSAPPAGPVPRELPAAPALPAPGLHSVVYLITSFTAVSNRLKSE